MFPELHETFILRELVALEQRGVDFDIFSLQYPRDPITLPDAIRLSRERTHYSGLLTPVSAVALLRTLFRHPLRVIGAVASVIRHGYRRPLALAKNLAILPLTLHIGLLGRRRGITHWHGHWANIPTTSCFYLGRILRQPWSAAIHGEDIFTPDRFLARKLDEARFCAVCSGYFCRHLQEEIGLGEPKRVHLNYHGLDPRVLEYVERESAVAASHSFPDRHAGAANLVSIGRLVATKGHDVLLRVLARLHDQGIDVTLTIVGMGPEREALVRLADECGVSDRVTFAGALSFDEVLAMLVKADAFCLAPRLIDGEPPDGIPNVIAEAMALNVPVVSTRVSAIPELVGDGESGWLVAVDDSEAFADAVVELLQDDVETKRRTAVARERVATLFDQTSNIDALIKLFQRYGGPRVAFVIESLSVGGAEQLLVAMANQLSGRGWDVQMICLHEAGELAASLDESVSLHVLDKKPGLDASLPYRLRRLIRRLSPDVINSHLWVANTWTRISLLGFGVPIIVTEHNRDSWKPGLYRRIDKLLARTTRQVIAVSEDTARFYRDEIGLPDTLVRVINNGIDTTRYAAGNGARSRNTWLEDASFLVGSVGRLVAQKNHARLLDAMALLRDAGVSNARLVIVGEGDQRESLERKISELDLVTTVTLAGQRDDVPDALAAFDVLVLSSDREGHPLTALEAQAAGTPVILTDVGGSADALARDGESVGGFLVAPDAGAIAHAIQQLVENPALCARMAGFAQRHALARFDQSRMVDAYEAVFARESARVAAAVLPTS